MRIGIDLGGSKIEAIALDHDDRELLRLRRATPAGDYQRTLEAIVGLIEQVESTLGGEGRIGIGTPGSLSPTRGVLRNANSTCLNGRPLQRDLEQRLGRPLRIANDADCFALSEATDGAASGASPVFGVIIGTGTGGGIVIDGRLLQGPNAIAGEWGHNPLPWATAAERPGPPCYCGKRGCNETFLSGPGLALAYREAGGETLSPPQIDLRAQAGDALAEGVLQTYEARLARGLASVINLIDPQVIVLGGGLSNLQRLYTRVPQLWGDYIFSDTVTTRLLPPHHGDASGVRGAARLWPNEPRRPLPAG